MKKKPKPETMKKKPKQKHKEITNHEEGTNWRDQTQTETTKKANSTNPDLPIPNRSAQTEPRQQWQKF